MGPGRNLSLRPLGGSWYELAVSADDFVGLISILTGLFASYGIHVVRGRAETANGRAEDRFEVVVPPEFNPAGFEKELSSLLSSIKGKGIAALQKDVHKRLLQFIRSGKAHYPEKLYPIDLKINQETAPSETVVTIESQDTFAFLYELSFSLSLLSINISRMEIETLQGRIKDTLWLTHEGSKIMSDKKLKQLQWAILFVKGFSHLLPRVPDPQGALEQFTLLGKDLFEREDFSAVIVPLKTSFGLENLSKVLGTSRFLWEEFIRSQYESIMPVLSDKKLIQRRKSASEMASELKEFLRGGTDFESRVEILNQYKDREMFRIDLRHLLGEAPYVGEFTEEFTDLAELIVQTACELAHARSLEKNPEYKKAGINANPYAVFGLGKFGGKELGYASDLEILFVYADDTSVAKTKPYELLEFYSDMVRSLNKIIRAKSTGVFEIDLRLRPYGKDGPLAVALSAFKKYYAAGGEAWNFERQALTKLRYIAGSRELAREVQEHRDRYVYGEAPFDFQDQLKMRVRQQQELANEKTWNAKYSAGALLDVEYLVQTLQITYGRKVKGDMRHPNTLRALRSFWQAGIIQEKQFQELRASYIFLRGLINALRIVRGNARDLNFPQGESEEYAILARRMGFVGDDGKIRAQFNLVCRHYQEMVSKYYEMWMERLTHADWSQLLDEIKAVPEAHRVNLDNVLRGDLTEEDRKALRQMGITDIQESITHLQRACPPSPSSFEYFAKVIDQTWPLLPCIADPDLGLKHLEWFCERLQDKEHFWRRMDESREGARALFTLFGFSRYLSDLLIFNAENYFWILQEDHLSVNQFRESLAADKGAQFTLESLRELRHRETLRLAALEMTRKAPLEEIYACYSDLAVFVLEQVLKYLEIQDKVGVIALGKLGGCELNFSSDVDLMFISDQKDGEKHLGPKIQEFVNILKQGNLQEFLYRVDLRLRPHGKTGNLVMNLQEYLHYYRNEAEAWEYQALIKARPVAGRKDLGEELVRQLDPLIWRDHWPEETLAHLRHIKQRMENETQEKTESGIDIKIGAGGIRDVEFSVQMLQLLNAHRQTELKETNTFRAIQKIAKVRLISSEEESVLRDAYHFLRRLENRLHLFENRQTFGVPAENAALRRIARSMGFYSKESEFLDTLRRTMASVRKIYEKIYHPGLKKIGEK